MDKEKFVSNVTIKAYYEDYQNSGKLARKITNQSGLNALFVPTDGLRHGSASSSTPRYPFTNRIWEDGFPTLFKIRGKEHEDQAEFIRNTDGTYNAVSVLGMSRYNRIIIHKVEIFFTPNVIESHKHFVQYSLKRVKNSFWKTDIGQTNNLAGTDHVSSRDDQFVYNTTFFSNSVVMDNLNWDLPLSDDIVLIQRIRLDKSVAFHSTPFGGRGINIIQNWAGLATNTHAHYDIVMHRSYGEI